MSKPSILVAGAGIFGLWQTYTLARAGYSVRLVDESSEPFASAASRWAGAMIAPECEAEGAPRSFVISVATGFVCGARHIPA